MRRQCVPGSPFRPRLFETLGTRSMFQGISYPRQNYNIYGVYMTCTVSEEGVVYTVSEEGVVYTVCEEGVVYTE